MPTIFTHAIVGGSLGVAFYKKVPARFWVMTTICSVVPDADVIMFKFGIKYGHMFGHRGFFHSLIFALIFAGFLTLVGFVRRYPSLNKWFIFIYFSVVTSLHTLMDALTNGGLGVALFSPFSNTRYFFPYTPIKVSPLGMGFFSKYGVEVMLNEITYLWTPCLIIVLISFVLRKILS